MPMFETDQEERILDFLRRRLPGWKTPTLKQRIKNGLVLRDGAPILSGGEIVSPGQTVEILAIPPRPVSRLPVGLGESPLPIVYADDDLIAVDKPFGLLSVATEREKNLTAIRVMREWLLGLERESGRELHAAHRLDREASGVLLLARSLEVKRKLAAEWRKYEKVYLAVVDGAPEQREGVVEVPLWEDKGLFVRVAEKGRGEEAITYYRIVKKVHGRSLLEVRLGTGRKHQIRVHLAHLGCPIVGDLRYGVSKSPRLALHAHCLRLFHPLDGRALELTAPLPPQFKKMLRGKH